MPRISFIWAVLAVACLGCSRKRNDWAPEDYFRNPEAIQACHAIKKNRIAEVEQLITGGWDANQKGAGNMTLLTWAIRYQQIEIFELLLKNGADPNVKFTDDFGHPFERDGSVMHIAARNSLDYLTLVLDHGGDANLHGAKYGDTPLTMVIKHGSGRKLNAIRKLIENGADVEATSNLGESPLALSISWGGQYEIALELLDHGADPMAYRENKLMNAVHQALYEARRSSRWTPSQAAAHARLIKKLTDEGYPVEEAREDLARWKTWRELPPDKRNERMKAEMDKRAS